MEWLIKKFYRVWERETEVCNRNIIAIAEGPSFGKNFRLNIGKIDFATYGFVLDIFSIVLLNIQHEEYGEITQNTFEIGLLGFKFYINIENKHVLDKNN